VLVLVSKKGETDRWRGKYFTRLKSLLHQELDAVSGCGSSITPINEPRRCLFSIGIIKNICNGENVVRVFFFP
jgi:hypothetical protein